MTTLAEAAREAAYLQALNHRRLVECSRLAPQNALTEVLEHWVDLEPLAERISQVEQGTDAAVWGRAIEVIAGRIEPTMRWSDIQFIKERIATEDTLARAAMSNIFVASSFAGELRNGL